MSSQPASTGLAAWLRLEQTAGIGPATARKLLAEFGLPENIFAATYSALGKAVPERIAQALSAPPTDETQQLIERTLEWLALPENHLLTLADDDYPKALLDIPDPPLLLYAKGRAELLGAPSLAVVGSRNATAQGIKNAENFARAMSAAGLTIVSGLALGIDAAAHRGGLDGNGSTIAVIGTGADIVYPARNRELAHRIAEQGCIVSEYPLGVPAISANFPRRNRLISGLAKGVLVVEAAAQSGSLITARMAAEQGREVFAIPGSIHSPLSKGCHQLIKQGAKLVESAQDILEELRLQPLAKPAPADATLVVNEETSRVLDAMGFDPVSADLLGERTGLKAAALNALLLTLELDGLAERLSDGCYRRLAN
ncbi:MAG: DNA-processing protein DprA [Burkholderiaceae bacterium]|nr:DNA-processing protein DprA [Burkholderiaceae bacterium]